jgi:plasmid stabilization system protein ParE
LKPIQIEPKAAEDSERAAVWYESQRLDLGTEFVLELDAAIERAAENPEAYEQIYRSIRRVLMRRFPYSVYFRYVDSAVRVIAVLHQGGEPEAWQSRIR